jgi:transketolase
MDMNQDALAAAATIARGLAIDAVSACQSGHLGLPLGAAEMGAVLFGHALRFHPREPRWINRDRLVLSAGHGSMFLYGWLHLAGYDVSLEAIQNFRQLHSITPGHPEFGETPGVEATTGPLGQGVGNAVGYAIAGKMAAARFNTSRHTILDYHVFALAGDGCLQEGISAEAASLAGHLGLDNLILIYDSNDVTLDALAKVTQSEDTAARFRAYGFDVVTVDGHNMSAFHHAVAWAKASDNGHPKLIIAKTEIGRGIPEVAGTSKAHGESGAKYAEPARQGLGLPAEKFYVSSDVREYFQHRQALLGEQYGRWEQTYQAWRKASPKLAKLLDAGLAGTAPDGLLDEIPKFGSDYADATRAAAGVVIQSLARQLPLLLTGSADLFGSTKNYVKDAGDFSREHPEGRNLWFGIREHAMGAIMNGIAYDGIFRASGATFTVFSDYMRPSIRLAALARLPVTYIFTHDSVGVGEDGPTHQPVEQCSSLRLIPNLDVIRPGDPEEVAGAFVAAMQRRDGPTALILSRQKVPTLHDIPVATRREGTLRGGYVCVPESGQLRLILIGTGSELQHALAAARKLGSGVRVVSMPSCERFDRQPEEYRDRVLPPDCRQRVVIEAGVPGIWHKYVGDQGRVVGVTRFGLSAPGDEAMSALGITPEAVIEAAQSL